MAKKPKDKPRAQKLKVFRTPIGFHDAYVAAASQKAALEAWGADANLFAQGIAEQVTDEKLIEEPLSRPGEVVKRLRGSQEEHLAAADSQRLPKKEDRSESKSGTTEPKSKSKAKPKPRPSRDALDEAEEALEKAEKKQRKAIAKLDEQIQRLERERRDVQRTHEAARDTLSEAVERARSAYQKALRAWEG